MAASEKMNQLVKKREEIEEEIKALTEVLESQKSVGMDGPLVDTEGFPRSDIDIYSVRHARHQIICLQNDYKELMKEIEEELYNIHAEARKSKEENGINDSEKISTTTTTTHQDISDHIPIGNVTSVDEGSPADRAGVRVDDLIIQFGSITAANFQGMRNIVNIVQHSVNKSVPITVQRESTMHHLSLVPSQWRPGHGLIGCNIKPTEGKDH